MRVLLGLALAALAGAAGAEAFQHQGLEAVKQRGHLKVCADPANQPYTSQQALNPGFEVELARLLARELGVAAEFQWISTYTRALRPLREGACDAFFGLPTDRRFREGNPWIAVSQPYYVMSHALVSRLEAPARSVAELAGQRVAVELGSIAEHHVGYSEAHRGLYRTQEEAFRSVVGRQAAAALLWYPVAAWLARDRTDVSLVPYPIRDLEFPIGVGVRRRDPGLAAAIDAAVGRLMANGEAGAVLRRYGAVPPPRSRGQSPFVPVQARDPVESGKSLFATACSRCHGAEGVGGGTGGAIPVLRNYDGGREKFMRIVMNGRKNTAMAGFKGILTEEEAGTIYQYLVTRPRQ